MKVTNTSDQVVDLPTLGLVVEPGQTVEIPDPTDPVDGTDTTDPVPGVDTTTILDTGYFEASGPVPDAPPPVPDDTDPTDEQLAAMHADELVRTVTGRPHLADRIGALEQQRAKPRTTVLEAIAAATQTPEA